MEMCLVPKQCRRKEILIINRNATIRNSKSDAWFSWQNLIYSSDECSIFKHSWWFYITPMKNSIPTCHLSHLSGKKSPSEWQESPGSNLWRLCPFSTPQSEASIHPKTSHSDRQTEVSHAPTSTVHAGRGPACTGNGKWSPDSLWSGVKHIQ